MRRIFGTINTIFDYGVDNEMLARSPSRGVKLPTPVMNIRRLPTTKELAALAFELGTDYAPLVCLGAVLGLRW